MSTIIAPTYVKLEMGYLKIHFYKNCKNDIDVNNGKYIEKNSNRFFDCYIASDAYNINAL